MSSAGLIAKGPSARRSSRVSGRDAHEFDFVLLFSLRYHQAYHGARALRGARGARADGRAGASLGLAIFQPILRGVRAIMYNSFEERARSTRSRKRARSWRRRRRRLEIPERPDPNALDRKFGLRIQFVLYVGRIEANKGCAELFDFYCISDALPRRCGPGRSISC